MNHKLEREELEKLYRRYGAGNGKELHPIELLYFIKKGIIEGNFDEVFHEYSKKDEFAEKKFDLFSFLRQRGYISKPLEGSYLLGYRKGFRPGEDRSTFLIKICDDEDIKELIEDLAKATSMRKELIYAIKTKDGYKFIKIANTRFD
jgi:tRNA splicing endonuclease